MNLYKIAHNIYGTELNLIKFACSNSDTNSFTSVSKCSYYEVFESKGTIYIVSNSTDGIPLPSICKAVAAQLSR